MMKVKKIRYYDVKYYRQSPIFLLLTKDFLESINANMATSHHSETAFQHFSNSLLQSDKIFLSLLSNNKQILAKQDDAIKTEI